MEMDSDHRRRALSGELGADVQRLELTRIAAESAPSHELLSRRQKRTVVIISVLFIATIAALVSMRFFVKRV